MAYGLDDDDTDQHEPLGYAGMGRKLALALPAEDKPGALAPGQADGQGDPQPGFTMPEMRADPRFNGKVAYDPGAENAEVPGALDAEERRLVSGIVPGSEAYGPPTPSVGGAIGAADPLGERAGLLQQWQAGRDRLHELEERRQAEMGPLYEQLQSTLAAQKIPEAPQLRRQPDPPNRQFDMGDYVRNAMMAAVFGSLISRQHVTGALNSFAGYMEGARQGNLDQAKIALDDWKAQSQAVVDDNKTMMDQYNAILKAQNMDLNQKMNAIQIAATKWQDQMRYQAAENKDIVSVVKSLEALNYHNELLKARNADIDIKRERLADARKARDGGKISEDLASFLGEQLAAGAPPSTVLTNLGRGAQGAENILKVREYAMKAAMLQGMSAADMTRMQQEILARGAGLRTAYTQEARMGTAAEEAKSTFPMALAARNAMPDAQVTGANRLLQGWYSGTGSPEQARLVVATLSASNAYAAVMNRGGSAVTVDARKHAEGLLNTAYSKAAYAAALDQMKQEMDQVLKAPEKSRARLLGKAPPEAPDKSKPDPADMR